jgi:hypothetical protein
MKTILFIFIILLLTNCKKDDFSNFGPFKPVSNIDDIIILGDNAQFVAYNVRTKVAEEIYKLPESYAGEFGYTAGHLLLTSQTAPGSRKSPKRYNINVETGEVVEHSMPSSIYYLPCQNEQLLEATAHGGYTTYRYNVVTNKLTNTFEHPIERSPYSYSYERGDTIYWFTDNFFHNENNKFIITSKGEKLENGNNDPLTDFSYRGDGYVSKRALPIADAYDKATISLEKIESFLPLRTSHVFTYPIDKFGGIQSTMAWEDKLVLFTASELYLIDKTGNILFRWGNYERESINNPDYKSFYSRLSKKIVDDKLYIFGQRRNTIENTPYSNCCVEIDLRTGEDNWIEVWKGWE